MLEKSTVCVLLCVVGSLPANVKAGEPKTADEVIARYIKAIGGRDKIDAIKTVRATGKTTQGEMEIPMVIEMKRPGKIRIEITFQGMTGVQAYDGKTGWLVMPFMGRTDPEKMPPDFTKAIADQADFDGPLIDYKKKGHKIDLVGKDEEDGSEVYKLKVVKKNGDTEYHFLDAEEFIPIKVKGKRKMQGTEIEFTVNLGDYKSVGGMLFAHSVQSGGGPAGGGSITFDKIEVNIDLPDKRFTMPEIKHAESGTADTDGSELKTKKDKPAGDKN